MHLVVDIGNTRVKAALFYQDELKHYFVFKNLTELFEKQLTEKYSIENCILVSVINGIEEDIARLKTLLPVIEYSISTPVPLKNNYKSLSTLGPDRIVGAVAGNFLFPSQNVLVIDFGTCIKYNFINANNEFIGGAISPGISIRFKSLNNYTARLPLLEPQLGFDLLTGTTTDENILSGVLLGAIAEVIGFIRMYQTKYSNLKIVLTGGDVEYFDKKIDMEHVVDSFLILKGLNTILNHNLTPSIAK